MSPWARYAPLAAAFLFLLVPGTSKGQSYTTAQLADGFDYPVGKPNGWGYYVYRGFSPYGHLGEDWNGNGGGNSDEGAPVYCIGHGVVVFSEDYKRGWGNVIIIRHAYRGKNGQIGFIDSLYGHLKYRSLEVGQKVSRGDKVGAIGRGPYNMYAAHLHFEIRKDLRVGMRRDLYAKTYETYYSPRSFLDSHRDLRYESRTVRVPINTFLRSNPNVIRTTEIEIPDIDGSQTVRPDMPEMLENVIEEQTSADDVKPEKTKTLFEKIFSSSSGQ